MANSLYQFVYNAKKQNDNVQFVIRITLKTDFLIDMHGKAIDGNHIGGKKPPTGNNVQGGDFESWFLLNLGPFINLPPPIIGLSDHQQLHEHIDPPKASGWSWLWKPW